MAERLFYILSMKWTQPGDVLFTWWRPCDAGYTKDVNQAGRYPEKSSVQADLRYYNNGRSTVAVPCELVEELAGTIYPPDVGRRTSRALKVSEPAILQLLAAAPFPFTHPHEADERWRGYLAKAGIGDSIPELDPAQQVVS